jgi:arylsulfatase A-like enzyme
MWIDDAVGVLMAALEAKGQLDNTFFLFQLDHEQEGKSTLTEPGVRIAQFIHYPKEFSPGSTFAGLVSTIDIAPTVLDFAGISSDVVYPMDGASWKDAVGAASEVDWAQERCLAFEIGQERAIRCGCSKFHKRRGCGNFVRLVPRRFLPNGLGW